MLIDGLIVMPNIFFHYWKPCFAYPAGHCAIQVGDLYADFGTDLYFQAHNTAPMPGDLKRNSIYSHFETGLKNSAADYCMTAGIRLPSSSIIYRIIYENLALENADLLEKNDLEELFSDVFRFKERWGNKEEIQNIFDDAIMLSKWFHEQQKKDACFATGLLEVGRPDNIIQLDFLDSEKALTALTSLISADEKGLLIWYAKSGPRSVKQSMLDSGKEIKLNCASLVDYVLCAGGIRPLFNGFNEGKYIVNVLQNSVRIEAKLRKIEPETRKISWLNVTSSALFFAGYGRLPITDHFGTVPAVLYEAVKHAIEKNEMLTHVSTNTSHQCVLL